MNHVPLILVAAELGLTIAELARRSGDAVIVDEIGLHVLPADVARAFIADHRASLQKARELETARREEARRAPHPVRDRVRAVQASQRPFSGSDGLALERLMTAEHADREQIYPPSGQMVYHKINERG